MILDKYNYMYALIPYEVAKSLGMGWRKVDSQNRVLLNQTELRGLEGSTFEEQVTNAGGTVMTAEAARYYSKTNTFSVFVPQPEPEQKPEPPTEGDIVTDSPEILPSFPDEENKPITLPSYPANEVELLKEEKYE